MQKRGKTKLEEQEKTPQDTLALVEIVKMHPELDFQFIAYQKEAERILDYAKSHRVDSDIEIRTATNDLGIISGLKKGIEERRQLYVRPINEHIKAVNSAFKLLTDPIEQADKITRDKILTYRAEVERKRREAEAINQAKIDLARREAEFSGTGEITVDTTPVIIPAAPPARIQADTANAGTAKVWKFEVSDENLLPKEFMLPDLVKIGKVVRAGVNIPGVKAWQEDSIRITTRY